MVKRGGGESLAVAGYEQLRSAILDSRELRPGQRLTTALSAETLAHLTEARVINEGEVLRLSVQRGDVAWESEVVASHHRLVGEPLFLPGDPPSRNPSWARAHTDFHHTLIKACGNPVSRTRQILDEFGFPESAPGGATGAAS